MLATAQFGLTSDEFTFLGLIFASLVAALVPVYVALLRQRRDTKGIKHEVSGNNGGVTGTNPTVKEYVKGAWDEAIAARAVADNARATAVDAARRLDDHLVQAALQWADITRRIQKVSEQIAEAEKRVVSKVDPDSE